ncbi:MAG: hypothetical protein KME43_24580 [Myxacorys chilensis ATA2-1-KO14]|jgi:hypothetical protein|nr:hypothetical protein [Myxacorys chilensis ATA2-1-KO14]
MKIADTLPPDPDNSGSVMGWSVFRMNPWSLYGVFETEHEANQTRAKAGSEYEVSYGSYQLGTDNFITS